MRTIYVYDDCANKTLPIVNVLLDIHVELENISAFLELNKKRNDMAHAS